MAAAAKNYALRRARTGLAAWHARGPLLCGRYKKMIYSGLSLKNFRT